MTGYRHVVAKDDYTDLASGTVLRSAPGFPAFPVRLVSEIFLRALELRGGDAPAVIWDPCCGSGYLLTVLGLLHRREVSSLVASDVAENALVLARENLALVDPEAMERRARVLEERAGRFGKPGYLDAAASARRLGGRLTREGGALPTTVSRADVFRPAELAAVVSTAAPDIVITDVPYEEQTSWIGGTGVPEMLGSLASVLGGGSVIAVTAKGRRVPVGDVARPRVSFRVGNRSTVLLKAADLSAG
ncbi:rRNA methyltransferase [Streptosporangium sp. NPDC000239]|uniref:rRNA methyltransferase n=1 Tax=unclassified Streptosporangium TaxID=2632669 RepID=UPI003316FF6F